MGETRHDLESGQLGVEVCVAANHGGQHLQLAVRQQHQDCHGKCWITQHTSYKGSSESVTVFLYSSWSKLGRTLTALLDSQYRLIQHGSYRRPTVAPGPSVKAPSADQTMPPTALWMHIFDEVFRFNECSVTSQQPLTEPSDDEHYIDLLVRPRNHHGGSPRVLLVLQSSETGAT